MQKANYLSTVTPTGGQGKYPLSTQTLDFIQQQVLLLQQFGLIGGNKYILNNLTAKIRVLYSLRAKFSRWQRSPYRRQILSILTSQQRKRI